MHKVTKFVSESNIILYIYIYIYIGLLGSLTQHNMVECTTVWSINRILIEAHLKCPARVL